MSDIHNAFKRRYELSMANPAQTMEGHINNENAITNDYSGRAIYEFFQNAIDRAEERIWIYLDTQNGTLTIANDGKPFSLDRGDRKYSDFDSLCSVNTSSKNQNESIGNKGVGFKSCWEYTTRVAVYSKHNGETWGFEQYNPMSRDSLRTKLDSGSYGIDIDHWFSEVEREEILDRHEKVPSFYFPIRVDNFSAYFDQYPTAQTVIVFNGLKNSQITELKEKIEEFSRHQIFFVKQLETLKDKNVTLELKVDGEVMQELSTSSNNEEWLIVSQTFDGDTLEKLQGLSAGCNYKVDNPGIAIAFPLTDNGTFEESMSDPERKFYCYLPTEVDCGFNVLIHADFLLDVSRKQINSNSYNDLLLDLIAELFVKTLLENVKLHALEYFGRFLIPKNRCGKFEQKVKKLLFENKKLTEILKKVYTKNAEFPLASYEYVFESIGAWKWDREPRRNKENYKSNVYSQLISHYCDEQIHIAPVAKGEKLEYVTSLPPKNEGGMDDFRRSLFYVAGKDFAADVNLLKQIPEIALTSFDGVKQLEDFGVIRTFSRLEIVRTLAQKLEHGIDNDGVKKDILRFCYQLIGETASPYHKYLFGIDSDIENKFSRILLPAKNNGGWHPAVNCYIDIDDEVCNSFDSSFYEVDIDICSEIFDLESNDECRSVLREFGVWCGILPLTKDVELPWSDTAKLDEISGEALTSLFAKSLVELWSDLDDEKAKQIRTFLIKRAWITSESGDAVLKPDEVFLFDQNDRRSIKCVGKLTKGRHSELYDWLGVNRIMETEDKNKLISCLQMLRKTDPELGFCHHKEIYRQVAYRLSQLTKETCEIPILHKKSAGSFTYAEGDVWFSSREHRRFQYRFNDISFAHFDEDTSLEFAENNGVKRFEPVYEIRYENSNKELCEGNRDSELKKELETNQNYLASLIALADQYLGHSFNISDVVKRWQKLDIRKEHNVILQVKLAPHTEWVTIEETNERNVDVLCRPANQNESVIIGVIAHDLDDPLRSMNLRKFGPYIASTVFKNNKLGSVFAEYFSLCSNSNRAEGGSGNDRESCVKQRELFLRENGVFDDNIESATKTLAAELLDDSELKNLITQLNRLEELEHITKENWCDATAYEKLDMTFDEMVAKIGADNKQKNALESIHPIQRNRMRLFQLKDDIALRYYISNNSTELSTEAFNQFIGKEETKKLLNTFLFKIDLFGELLGIRKLISEEELWQANHNREYELEIIEKDHKEYELCGSTHRTSEKRHVGTVNTDQEIRIQRQQKKRGEGLEIKLVREAIDCLRKDGVDCIESLNIIKEAISKEPIDQNHIDKYLNLVKKAETELSDELYVDLLHVSKTIGDGLGYDILVPEFVEGQWKVLKVEVKSNSSLNKIFLSENERQVILAEAEKCESNWRLWLNNKNNDLTDKIKEWVVAHDKTLNQVSYLTAESWVINLKEK